MDRDVSEYLRKNKPLKYNGQKKYFQWFNQNYGSKELTQHIWKVIRMAKACQDIDELKKLAEEKFNRDIDL